MCTGHSKTDHACCGGTAGTETSGCGGACACRHDHEPQGEGSNQEHSQGKKGGLTIMTNYDPANLVTAHVVLNYGDNVIGSGEITGAPTALPEMFAECCRGNSANWGLLVSQDGKVMASFPA